MLPIGECGEFGKERAQWASYSGGAPSHRLAGQQVPESPVSEVLVAVRPLARRAVSRHVFRLVDARGHPKAVELDFMQPLRPRRRLLDRLAELRGIQRGSGDVAPSRPRGATGLDGSRNRTLNDARHEYDAAKGNRRLKMRTSGSLSLVLTQPFKSDSWPSILRIASASHARCSMIANPTTSQAIASASGEVHREPLQINERTGVEGTFVRSPQNHTGRLARLERLLPARRTQAPTVAGSQAGKAKLWHRRRKIIAAGFGKLEELSGHDGADGMTADVFSNSYCSNRLERTP